jgi:resuscitation-promoting factor RpfA
MSNHERNGPQSPDKDKARDGSLTQAWRQASDEQPPPELDAAIIAAARKSVQDRDQATKTVPASARQRNRWMRWQPLAAAATVAGLAFVLVQMLPSDRDVAPSIRMEESAAGPATAEEKQSATAPAVAAPQATVETTLGTAASIPSAPEATAKAPSQAAAEATVGATAKAAEIDATATADGAVAIDAADADQRKAVVPEMAGRAASAEAPGPALERSLGNAAPSGAADRAAGIAALYAAGDVAGAADSLRAFRAADPDADTYLPNSLRSWARTVK